MTEPVKCNPTDHDYRKFDEASIVCRRCGDQRIVDIVKLLESLPRITYLPCPHHPVLYWPSWSTGTSDVTITDVTIGAWASNRPVTS